jgi:prephenate dehydrogenase
MGRWFAEFLANQGNIVTISGRNQQRLQQASRQLGVKTGIIAESIDSAEIIILSVPIDSFEDVVREISPYILPGQKIIDITSVKTHPVSIMHKYINKGLILGTHPMFGPGAKGFQGNSVILTPTNDDEHELAQKVELFLNSQGAKVIYTSPEEHDRMMSLLLGLTHFIAIVTADSMSETGILQKAADIGGVTFNALLNIAGAVISEDPEFYASLQMNLPYLPEFTELYSKKTQQWAEIVKNKDKAKFVAKMSALREHFAAEGIDLKAAYQNLYKLAGKESNLDK